MKKLFTVLTIFALAFTACEQPTDNNEPEQPPKFPTLTIKNESSFDLTNVKFSGHDFFTPGYSVLLRSTQAVVQLTENDVNKTGYITFTRDDIKIDLRTEAVTVTNENKTITFLDTTVVEEVANSGNKKTLSQISFQSQLTVEYGSLKVAKNETLNFGETLINNSKPVDFVLKNTGVGKLLFTGGTEPVKISSTEAGVFSVLQPSSSEIAPNGSLSFKINFAPKSAQTYTATVTISSNDQNGDFTFYITASGTIPKPISVVVYNGSEIPQNGTINAGEEYITMSKSITVTIKNNGLGLLTIDTANIAISGADAAAFVKTTNPGVSVSAGNDTLFFIECKPAKEGVNQAVLTIPTNDDSRNPVIVYLQVTGRKGTPVLELTQGTRTITNNTITPVDFERIGIGSSQTLTFTIKNTGNDTALELTGNPLVESSNPVFAVSSQPANRIIKSGETVSFVIRYTPATEGEVTGNITIANNTGSGQFVFPVKGTGYRNRPQINIQQGTAAIALHDSYDFGTIAAGKTKDIVFTIKNSGDANLNIETVNDNRINITDNASGYFSVTQQPSASTVVTPGNTTTFTVRFSPTTAVNNYSSTVKIKTNSGENAEFLFTVKGSAGAASTEARLSGLQFNRGKLDQQFNSNIYNYTLKIDAGQTLLKVTPTSANSNISELKVNGIGQNSGVQSQDIILATTNTVTIVVTAEDGTTTLTYTVTINRITDFSSTALSSLYVSNMNGTDTEDVLGILDANNKVGWLALPDETQLKFRVTPLNSNATVKVNNSTITNGVYTAGYNLNSGSAATTFTITVTSEEGENTRTITVESKYLGSQWERVGNFPTSGSNSLTYDPYFHEVVVHNNQFIMTNLNEVYRSSNGVTWNRIYTYPDNIEHDMCSSVILNNTIYNIGGYRKITSNNWEVAPIVSYSTNGTNWTIAPSVTGLTNGIIQHTSVVFNNAIYTMGGETKTAQQTNAVWKSTNGTTWTQQTAPSWGARTAHASVVFNNKIYVIGGAYNDGNSEYRDVWSSANGTSWTQETASAAWTGRNDHTVNANSKGMWLVGGNDGFFKKDVWFSRDGKTWTQVLQNASFAERAAHAAAIKDGYLYIFGGVNRDWDNPNCLYDIWRTYIGD